MKRKTTFKFLLSIMIMGVMLLGEKQNYLSKLSSNYISIVNAEETYTVTFKSSEGYLNGEKDLKEKSFQVKAGESISDAPYGERLGYVLLGWKTEGDSTLYDKYSIEDHETHSIFAYIPTKDTVFEAQWEEGYTVSFEANGGCLNNKEDVDEVSVTVQKGEAIKGLDPYADKSGYIFTGWKIEGAADTVYTSSELWSYVPDGNLTFEAQWEEGYIIKFLSEQGYIDGEKDEKEYTYTVSKKTGQTLEEAIEDIGECLPYMPYGAVNGIKFIGWKIEGDESKKIYSDYQVEELVITGNTTFSAQWSEVYKVTWKSEEGYLTGNPEDTIDEDYVEKKKEIGHFKEGFLRPGYKLAGWKEESSGKVYKPYELSSFIPEADTVFIAQWKEAYHVFFYSEDANEYYQNPTIEVIEKGKSILEGGDHPGNNVVSLNYHDILSREYTDGRVFLGWKVEGEDVIYGEESTDEHFIGNFIPKKDTIFRPCWKINDSIIVENENNYLLFFFYYYFDEYTYSTNMQVEKVSKGSSIGNITSTFPHFKYGNKGFIGWKTCGDDVLYKNSPNVVNSICNYAPTQDMFFSGNWGEVVSETDDEIDDSDKDPTQTGNQNNDNESGNQNGNQNGSNNTNGQNSNSNGSKKDEKTNSSSLIDNDNTGNQGTNNQGQTGTETPTEVKKEETPGLSIGTVTSYNNIRYKVDSEDTVSVQKLDNKKASSITIPDTVSFNNKEYRVASVDKQSFANNKKFKKITIGANVTSIKLKAFFGCKNLKTIVIKSKNIKSIGSKAFKGINKKATIYVPKSLKKKEFSKYKKMLKKAGVPKSVKIKKK